jgi:hypothetical protein
MNPLNNIKMRNKFEHEIAKDNIYKKMHITKLGGRAMHIEKKKIQLLTKSYIY